MQLQLALDHIEPNGAQFSANSELYQKLHFICSQYFVIPFYLFVLS